MSTFLKTLISFIFLSGVFSCSKENKINTENKDTLKTYTIPVYNNYMNDTNISDENGNIKFVKRRGYKNFYFYNYDKPTIVNKLLPAFYLPFNIKGVHGIQNNGIDTGINEAYTSAMSLEKEPVLSNFYLGKEMIRMYLVAALRLLVQTTIIKNDSNIAMEIKTNNPDGTMARLPDKILSTGKWDSVLTLIDKAGFWKSKPYKKQEKTFEDGYWAVLEAHFKDSYWFAVWEDEGALDKTMNYIINLTDIK